MSATGVHSLDTSITRTNSWLADIAASLGTDDRRMAFRIARAWLLTLRDELTVDVAVAFGEQLTEVLRGVYYQGWEPGQVPVRSGPAEYAAQYALQARIRQEQVWLAAGVVTAVARRHLPPGAVDRVLAALPAAIRELLEPAPTALAAGSGE